MHARECMVQRVHMCRRPDCGAYISLLGHLKAENCTAVVCPMSGACIACVVTSPHTWRPVDGCSCFSASATLAHYFRCTEPACALCLGFPKSEPDAISKKACCSTSNQLLFDFPCSLPASAGVQGPMLARAQPRLRRPSRCGVGHMEAPSHPHTYMLARCPRPCPSNRWRICAGNCSCCSMRALVRWSVFRSYACAAGPTDVQAHGCDMEFCSEAKLIWEHIKACPAPAQCESASPHYDVIT